MKKTSFETIKTALTNYGFDNAEILAELDREINRGAEAKAQNAKAYDAIHDLVIETLGDAPITCGELYEAIADKLPADMGKGKVQYALTHLWQDEIVKIVGKPNTYRKA